MNHAEAARPDLSGTGGAGASTPLHRPARSSRGSVLASGVFFFSYLIVQTAIPVYALFCGGWFSFVGWTMYTGLKPELSFTVVYQDGRRESLEQIQQRLGIGIVVGHKVDTARFVPPYLCGALPEARAVEIREARAGTEETFGCRR
jgi:hypothetical protein